ncbi:DUF1858 domain-containing protein [Dysgonomonas macrotermitis]|uniref:Uncharacterized conserved protein n=1 Tax=Dysgonomonas macrotermitis TaxID=1346286 RepID=A0A1M4SW64_9BACT|nr:DUF1858 domain-containing protein [Dysgonomonas macrotermitis]SHE36426.1 Uncharacterized conserved protein [Dysgonomonas macrotermitis]
MEKPDITLQTKVGEILQYYPELEDVLLSMSPAFAKLKNPILRRTVAKVASLKQVAEVGGIDAGFLISTLRKAANLMPATTDTDGADLLTQPEPDWINIQGVTDVMDVCSVIEQGRSPMNQILSRAAQLENQQVLKLITPFVPVPIIDILKNKGYKCWSKQNELLVETYILRS